jgi:alanine racemase
MGVAIEANVSLTVWSWDQIQQAAEMGRQLGREARLHLKIDSGMSRLGASPQDGLDLIRRMQEVDHIQTEGLFSHLAKADELSGATTTRQLEVFKEVLDQVEAEGLRPPLVHVANSAGALKTPDSRFDIVRVGILIYGMHASEDWQLPEGYRPVLSWKSQLSQVKTVQAGTGLSYGHEYLTIQEERIGTVPVGYADGFRRVDGNQVLVGGKFVDVVGRVTMDQILVQLDEVPHAAVGDEVVIIGEQDGAAITAEDIASRWGTVNYEVTCGIGARVPRLYLADDEIVLHEQFSADGRRIIQPYEI